MLKFSIRIQNASPESAWSCSLQYRHRVRRRRLVYFANDCFLFSFARNARSESGKYEAGQCTFTFENLNMYELN